MSFVPVLFEQKGWDPAAYGTITSSYWIASALSGLIFGRLADRFDRRKVMMLSMLSSAPAFYLLPAFDGPIAFLFAIAAGGLSGGAHSLIVVMAQDLIPMRKGFASGAILGFIFGTGAIGTLIIGAVSDYIGLGNHLPNRRSDHRRGWACSACCCRGRTKTREWLIVCQTR